MLWRCDNMPRIKRIARRQEARVDIENSVLSFIASDTMRNLIWAVILACATAVASKVVKRALHAMLDHPENPLPASSLIINIGRGVVWVIGGSIILQSCFGINPNALVTALGVGGVALSLGLQDTLSNLIGGIQMTLMGVVRPGDNIEIGSETGVVTDVGLRHTTIITKLGETVIVPNSVISKTSLVQLPPAEQFKVPFCATGDASKLDEIAAEIAERAKAAAESVSPVTQEPKVFFSEITEYGFRGSIVMRVEDSAATGRAADAVVRAIAPLTR